MWQVLVQSGHIPMVYLECVSCKAQSIYEVSQNSYVYLRGTCTNCQGFHRGVNTHTHANTQSNPHTDTSTHSKSNCLCHSKMRSLHHRSDSEINISRSFSSFSFSLLHLSPSLLYSDFAWDLWCRQQCVGVRMRSLYNWSQREYVWSLLTRGNNLKDKTLVESLGLKLHIPADCAQLYSNLGHFYLSNYTVLQFSYFAGVVLNLVLFAYIWLHGVLTRTCHPTSERIASAGIETAGRSSVSINSFNLFNAV